MVEGAEIHEHSSRVARDRARAAGGTGKIRTCDFFSLDPEPRFDAVIGNPPFVRYQDWTGVARSRSREAALKAGVTLNGLASSWAAFTVQSALFLRNGGRLGLVLPAELLSVNYAAPVRKFLFENFRAIELVLFEKQLFEDAEADTLLLLADGFREGPTDNAVIRQVRDAEDVSGSTPGTAWRPVDPSDKWIDFIGSVEAAEILRGQHARGNFVPLSVWGKTSLGMVTGNNRYFALSPSRVRSLGLRRSDLIRLSPPGSSHLRGLTLSKGDLLKLGRNGRATWMFRPNGEPSPAARAYIAAGETAGVDEAYKCRVRPVWWRVPLNNVADLLLTYMNADAARLIANEARVNHLNSVHGVYLNDEVREIGTSVLPIAALSSPTLLSAELVGRSYGGGVLKLEPREAGQWLMPSPDLVESRKEELVEMKPLIGSLLRAGALRAASEHVDEVLLGRALSSEELGEIRAAHRMLQSRRENRGRRG